MILSVIIARALGLFCIIMACIMVAVPERFKTIANQLRPDSVALFITNVVALITACFLVTLHSLWMWNWVTLITLIGFIMLVKSIIWICLPEAMISLARKMTSQNALWVGAAVSMLVGALLLFLGLNPQLLMF